MWLTFFHVTKLCMTSRVCLAALQNYAIQQITHLFIDCSLRSRFLSAFCNYTSQILTVPTGIAVIRKYSESRPLSNHSFSRIHVDLPINNLKDRKVHNKSFL